MIDHIDSSLFKAPRISSTSFRFSITPFQYQDGKAARLPRRRSPQHNLPAHTSFYFNHVLAQLNRIADRQRYSVEIIVKSGQDTLGKADIDNYCKAVLDGITTTKKIWLDDKQVDILIAKRISTLEKQSSLDVIIKVLK